MRNYVILVNDNNLLWAMEMTGKSLPELILKLEEAKQKRVVCTVEAPLYKPEEH